MKFISKDCFFAPRVGPIRNLSMTATWLALIFICLKIDNTHHLSSPCFAVTAILIGVALVNLLFLQIRRLNDAGFSGLYFLVYFIPLFGAIFHVTMYFLGSSPANKYGQPPVKPMLWDYLLFALGTLTIVMCMLLWAR